MRDKISLQRINTLHPLLRKEAEDLINIAESRLPKHLAIRVTHGLRTFAEQQALYQQGRTKPGKIVTNAAPGSSYHNYGLALDFAILYDKDKNGTYDVVSWDVVKDEDKDGISDWKEIAQVFVDAGWTWGGHFKSFKDYPHVEKTFGKKWQELLGLRNKKVVDAEGYVIINK